MSSFQARALRFNSTVGTVSLLFIAVLISSSVQAGQKTWQTRQETTTKKTMSGLTPENYASVHGKKLASLLLGETSLTRKNWSGSGLKGALGPWNSYDDNEARIADARKAAWSKSGISESVGSWDSCKSDRARNDALMDFIASSGSGMRQGLRDLLGNLGYGGGMFGNNAGDPGGGGTSGDGGTGGKSGSGGKGGKGGKKGKGGKSGSDDGKGALGDDALKLGDTDSGSNIHSLFPPRMPVQTRMNIMLGYLLVSGGSS